MIETLMLAVKIEEEQLETAKRDSWAGPEMEKALNALNETAQNIHAARSHGRVSKKMERVLFKRLGKVAQAYMRMIRAWNATHQAPKVEIGELKITQHEFEDGTVVTELEPAEQSNHDAPSAFDKPVEGLNAVQDTIDLSMKRPLKERVNLRTDGFADPNRLRDAMAMTKTLQSAEDDDSEE